jgi:hypothetical protein
MLADTTVYNKAFTETLTNNPPSDLDLENFLCKLYQLVKADKNSEHLISEALQHSERNGSNKASNSSH